MDRRTLNEALRLLDARRPFARAVVVRSVGSVPGKVGATMIVRDDGTTMGTVGGAALEEKVKELAAEALERQRGDLYHFDLQKWREGGLPSLCGGSVDIAIEYVAAPPHLLLWGGGHVAKALAEAIAPLGYDCSVADDRPDWVGPDRFPVAVRRTVTTPEGLWETLRPSAYSHLYVLGYDARKDLEVLRRSLEVFPGYIGLIASETKREHLFADLRRAGASDATLTKVRSPIGLSIGAETPAEIAVSIVAELVRDRHLVAANARAKSVSPTSPEPHGVGTA
jgi:xanthine dehydrogenase accessory factor